MIGGVIKYFRFDYEYVLWGIGYVNLVMLLATIPVYESEDEKEPKKDVVDFGDNIQALANYLNNKR